MTITAGQVKELRERTGAGMMECKKVLMATDGDIDKAIEEMRKSGQAKADKKSGRIATEGIVVIEKSADQKLAVVIEVNCETDFVARDVNFTNFAGLLAKTALNQKVFDVEQLANAQAEGSEETLEKIRQALVVKIGENIKVRRIAHMETQGVIGTYTHSGRIAVMVDLQGGDESLAKDLAMHIAASRPIVVNREDVPEELVNKEKEIFSAQAKESGKPEEIIAKMVTGRINKFLGEVSLLGQPFVKDPNIKVDKLLQDAKAKVNSFIRFEVGEGLEKKEDNFVAEVMEQVRG